MSGERQIRILTTKPLNFGILAWKKRWWAEVHPTDYGRIIIVIIIVLAVAVDELDRVKARG
jgi:hypothetical protein